MGDVGKPTDKDKLMEYLLKTMNKAQAIELIEKMTLDITDEAMISVKIDDNTSVTISLDKAILVHNKKTGVIITVNASGSSSALIHPFGRIEQLGTKVQIAVFDWSGHNDSRCCKYAKMSYKGVAFCSGNTGFTYRLDEGGAHTTHEVFKDLTSDIATPVFLDGSRYGSQFKEEADAYGNESYFNISKDLADVWIINNVKVSRSFNGGEVSVKRGDIELRLTLFGPKSGNIGISTKFLHCTVSCGTDPHLFVKRGDMRIHYNGTFFNVRHAGFSAALDNDNKINLL